MRSVKALIIVIGSAALCAACSGGKVDFKVDAFSKNDMCIVKVDDKKQVCYGDKRSDAEEILGAGTQNGAEEKYDFGASVIYRDDAVVGIVLHEESKGRFETVRGAKIGDSKDRIMKLYGEKYAIQATENNLDYAYDLKNKKFIDQVTLGRTTVGEGNNIYDLSMMFGPDSSGASFIGLIDYRAAISFS